MAAAPTVFHAAGAPSGRAAGGARPQVEHAFLQIHTPPPAGTTQGPGPREGTIEFQFNPKELSLAKSASWARKPARAAARSGVPEFVGSEPATLSLEMFLDATGAMDDSVVRRVERLFACLVPSAATRQRQKPSPPWVQFRWGNVVGFAGFLTSVNARYTLFTPGGLPVRALCTVEMQEISGETGGQNPTSGALAARSARTLVAGDSLASVAHQEYGDATLWRALAEANDIDDPMRLPEGRTLLVPALEDLAGGDRGQ